MRYPNEEEEERRPNGSADRMNCQFSLMRGSLCDEDHCAHLPAAVSLPSRLLFMIMRLRARLVTLGLLCRRLTGPLYRGVAMLSGYRLCWRAGSALSALMLRPEKRLIG